MRLATVVGQLVSTIKCPGLEQGRLLLVDFIDASGKPEGTVHVCADNIGAGTGEWVLVAEGSSARRAINDQAPIDMAVIGIVDEVVIQDHIVFHK